MRKKGFTLIELLIVVAIIAILALIAVPNFLEAQVRSKTARCKADMRSVLTALEAYGVDHTAYPIAADINDCPLSSGFHSRLPSYLSTPIAYITSLPYDPFVETTWDNACYPVDTLVGKRYVYYNTPWLVDFWGDSWNGLVAWVGEYLIYGYGPDRLWANNPAVGPDTLEPYDPTNGTISYGNIIRCQKMTDGIPPHPVTGTYHW